MKRSLTERDIIRAKRFNYTAFAILLLGLLALGGWLVSYRAAHHFTPQKWQTAQDSERMDLYGDLLARYELEGMPVSEVTALLGESDDTFRASPEHLVYFLGFDDYFPIDAWHLVLTVTEGVVTKVQVLQD